APVHARLPTVLLPAGAGQWRIEARRAGSGPVLAAITTTPADWRPDQLWRQVSRPVLGTVTVTVTPADRWNAPERHRGGRARRSLLPRAPADQRAGPGACGGG